MRRSRMMLGVMCMIVGCDGESPASMDAGHDPDAAVTADAGDLGDAGPGPAIEHLITGLASGDTAEITIEHEGALGLQIIVEATSRSASGVGIEQLTAPSGELWIEGFAPLGVGYPTALGESYLAVAQLPASSALPSPIPAGTYRVRVVADRLDEGATLTIRAREQRVDGGALDIRVWLPEGLTIGADEHVVTASAAPTDPDVAVRLDAFYEAAALFGMQRGVVTFHALDASFRTLDSYRELLDAAAATGRDASPGAHFLWADGVTLDGVEVWGVSTGIPGAGGYGGTPSSAVALDVSTGISEVGDGWTMAHELGHFAGLFHTTELSGGYFDAVDDTAECADIVTSPFGCPERRNLMFPVFWGASGGTGIEASAEQRRILAGNPFTRALGAGDHVAARSASAAAAPDPRLARLAESRAGLALLASTCAHSPDLDVAPHEREALASELDALRSELSLPPFLSRRASALSDRLRAR